MTRRKQQTHLRSPPWGLLKLCLTFCGYNHVVWLANGCLIASRSRWIQRSRRCDPITTWLVPQQLGSFQELSIPKLDRRVLLLNYASGENNNNKNNNPIPFEEMWNVQKEIMEAQTRRLAAAKVSPFLDAPPDSRLTTTGVDTIIFLQHEPVYTLGTSSDPGFIRSLNTNVPVIRMDRGGEVTYHGPGQLVVYLLLDLRSYKTDIHWYIRALEEVIIRALNLAGVQGAGRNNDTTGVWVDNHKVAAIGVKCRKWITMHGIAINVDERSLPYFEGIVPCGLEGRKVGCVNQFIRHPMTIAELCAHVRTALEEVFQIQLIER